MENQELELEENIVIDSLQTEIEKRVEELKKEKATSRIIPIVVEPDEFDNKDKPMVAYFKRPSFSDFSKFTSLGKTNEMQALRQLGRDCFLDGDKDMLDNDDIYLYGTMSCLSSIITFRRSQIVNLSKGKK